MASSSKKKDPDTLQKTGEEWSTDEKDTSPAIVIAKRRIEKEYEKLEYIAKSFPKSKWFSFPAFSAIIVIIAAGMLSYLLFNPEKFSSLTLTFLFANVSIYLILLVLTLWFQFKFMRPAIWTMKDRFSKFKIANKLLKKHKVKDFIKNAEEHITDYVREDAVLPFVFLVSIFSEWGSPDLSRTRQIYELFKFEEEERVSRFIDGSRRFLLWLIRIGIIGTFLGLMTAFVFLGGGVSQIFASEEQVAFKEAVSLLMKQSLFGYAAAVLSSLGANLASILYEFFSLRKLQRFNLSDWMDAVFQWYILSSQRTEGFVEDVKNMLNTLQRVSSAVRMRVVEINKMLEDANFYKDFPSELDRLSRSPRAFQITIAISQPRMASVEKYL